jgi:hypothetical protein
VHSPPRLFLTPMRTATMANVMDTLRRHPRVEIADDERGIGNGVIVTLREGWTFDPVDPENRVRGEDTASEMLKSVRAAYSSAEVVAAQVPA